MVLRQRVAIAMRHLSCLILVGLIVVVYSRFVHVNATTVSLTFLMAVLGVATVWGLAEAVVTSFASVLAFNFFFLPPLGTFTIDDPQNWIALAAFLLTAITTSQLSTRAKRRALEAQARAQETASLYELGRAILMREELERIIENVLIDISRIFDLTFVGFYSVENRTIVSIGSAFAEVEVWHRVAVSRNSFRDEDGRHIVAVRLGEKSIGSIGFAGAPLSSTVADAIANFVAIALERKQVMQRAALAEAARRSEELRTALVDGMAHDLKTPLTAIKASVSGLLPRAAQLDATGREFLNIIEEETERLQRTLSDAIEMARIDSGQLKMHRSAENVLSIFAEMAVEKNIGSDRMRMVVSTDLPLVHIDPDLMKFAGKQILDNALKYSPDTAPIEISAREDGGTLVVDFADRGPGVSENERHRIFEKFYRGESGRSSASGTGMGLAIAKAIVEAHGGRIWVSRNPAGGAIFSLQLPLAENAVASE